MRDLRANVSFILEAGHTEAADYPIAALYDEAALVKERQERMLASHGAILDATITAGIGAFSTDGGKQARAFLAALLARLSGGEPEPTKKNMADLVKAQRGSESGSKGR